MRLIYTILLAVVLATVTPLNATTVGFTTTPGMFTTVAGATTTTFDGLTSAQTSPYVSGISTYTWVGSTPFYTGSVVNHNAAPPGDTTTYVSVGSYETGQLLNINFSTPINYFGMYMGSPDTYNHISFYSDATLITTYTGGQLIPPGNGDQSSSAYLNFTSSGGTFNKIVMSSDLAAFESDNHATGAVPEPASLFLIGSGLCLFSYLRSKSKRA